MVAEVLLVGYAAKAIREAKLGSDLNRMQCSYMNRTQTDMFKAVLDVSMKTYMDAFNLSYLR